jgi:hypothetical protein
MAVVCLYIKLTFVDFRAVLVKLVAFSISLAVVPITLYFVSLKYIWNGQSR